MIALAATLAIGLVAFRVTIATTGGFLVWSDGVAYFFHARSLVIDGNSDITNEFDEFDRRVPLVQHKSSVMDSIRVNVSRRNDGTVVSPWPVGMGLIASPFYAVGYGVERILARIKNRPPDSYGIIPQYFFALSSLVFGLLGFWATFLCCRRISDSRRSYLATIGIVCASPAIFYIFVNPSMAHAVSFGLCASLVLLWLRGWMDGGTIRTMLILGFLLGLLIVIRLQNVIFGLLLATLVIRDGFRENWKRSLSGALVGLTALLLPLSAHALHSMLYGPAQATNFNVQGCLAQIGSYTVHLGSPFFWDVLLSCRHGAFNWAPILGIGAVGLLWLATHNSWGLVLLVAFLLHAYLIGGIGIADPFGRPPTFDLANWNEHWKGGASFGMRYLAECTPLLAIGAAALLNLFRNWVLYFFWQSVIAFLIAWNGLLVVAYGLNTVSRTHCVTYAEKWAGVSQVFAKVLKRAY